MNVPCHSLRLLRPVVQLLRENPLLSENLLEDLDALDADARVPIATVHAILETAVSVSGDRFLGLRAAAKLSLKDLGLLGYTIASGSNVGEAVHAGSQYMRLATDAFDVAIVQEGGQVEVQFETHVALPRPAEDYLVCGILAIWLQAWPAFVTKETRVCLRHAAPLDLERYREALPVPTLSFRAPFQGLVLPATSLNAPLEGADAHLHAVLRECADETLVNLPSAATLTERVRTDLIKQLATGAPDLSRVATHLQMSPSMLRRRLEAEGTSPSDILDTLRRSLAMRYLREDMKVSEIAQRIGFKQSNTFHRAFRRWTGMTPRLYSQPYVHGRDERDAALASLPGLDAEVLSDNPLDIALGERGDR